MDGYKTSQFNCVDIPIAACTGAFNRENYFYYCLYYNYFYNWKDHSEKKWFEIRSEIMSYLGLSFNVLSLMNDNDILKKIEYNIGFGYPIFLVVKYGSLFYSPYYKDGTYDHGLIVSDFNRKNKTLGIRDREFVKELIQKEIIPCDILKRMSIRYEEFNNIWINSNSVFKNEKSIHYNQLYYIKKEKDIATKDVLIEFLKNNIKNKSNQLEIFLLELQKSIIEGKEISNSKLVNMRRIFLKSNIIYHDLFKKILVDIDNKLIKENIFLYNKFIKNREFIIDKIQYNIIAKKELLKGLEKDIFDKDSMYFNNFIINFLQEVR